MRMRKNFIATAVAVACLALLPGYARAATITYYFDCQIIGGTTCPDTTTQGFLTLTDGAAGTVTGTVDLNGSGVEKVQELVLNVENLANPSTGWTFTGVTGVTYSLNSVKPDGYGGFFDLLLNAPNNQFEPLNFSLTHAGLSVANFQFKDTLNQLFTAVHIGAYNGTNCSIWEGAKDTTANTGGSNPSVPSNCDGGGGQGVTIPEPASMLLFGFGALAAAARARRRFVA